jgi:hypothetical protein
VYKNKIVSCFLRLWKLIFSLKEKQKWQVFQKQFLGKMFGSTIHLRILLKEDLRHIYRSSSFVWVVKSWFSGSPKFCVCVCMHVCVCDEQLGETHNLQPAPYEYPARARDFSLIFSDQRRSGEQPTSYIMGTGALSPRVNSRAVKLTTHFRLLPRSRIMELYLHYPIRLHRMVVN